METRPEERPRNPWLWVPSLYFSEGVPYVVVMTMSVVMYKRLGISNTDIAFYTSWLSLPWVVKPLWSPWVDITRTKRFWIVAMQFMVAAGLALAALSVARSGFFKWSLCLFGMMALASATHDIAADGFYMLGLNRHEQAWWVGLRSTAYRLAMIVGSGLLVVLAGVMETRNGLPPVEIPVLARTNALPVLRLNRGAVKVTAQGGDLRLIANPPSLVIAMKSRSGAPPEAVMDQARKWNREHGFLMAPVEQGKAAAGWWQPVSSPVSKHLFAPLGGAWQRHVSRPLETFLRTHFAGETKAAIAQGGNVGVVFVTLSKPPPADKSVVVSLDRKRGGFAYSGLAGGGAGFRLAEGERLVFNAANWNHPAMVVIQLEAHLAAESQVLFVASSGDIPLAWSITLFAAAGIFLLFSLWHGWVLPRPASDGPVRTNRSLAGEFLATLGSFFRKPGIGMALAFILLYRLDEAQLSKVISPFLLDGRAAGGLGLTTSQVGLAYGTFGILALTCGGLLGGFAAARHGLKTMLPFMVGSMYLPKLAFVFLSFAQPGNFLVVCGAIGLEQLGYGFGFTAFMLYMLYFADGPHKTAHYAICTGFMALGMMIPGMWSGWVADIVGYRHFFVWVICSALPGLVIALSLKVDPQFGRKGGAVSTG